MFHLKKIKKLEKEIKSLTEACKRKECNKHDWIFYEDEYPYLFNKKCSQCDKEITYYGDEEKYLVDKLENLKKSKK